MNNNKKVNNKKKELNKYYKIINKFKMKHNKNVNGMMILIWILMYKKMS